MIAETLLLDPSQRHPSKVIARVGWAVNGDTRRRDIHVRGEVARVCPGQRGAVQTVLKTWNHTPDRLTSDERGYRPGWRWHLDGDILVIRQTARLPKRHGRRHERHRTLRLALDEVCRAIEAALAYFGSRAALGPPLVQPLVWR